MPSLSGGFGSTVFGGAGSGSTQQAQAVNEEQLLSAAKADITGTNPMALAGASAGCPRVQVGGSGNHVTLYEAGRIGDALAITHRGEITKTARECTIEGGRVVVKYGFSGRVLMGPRGGPGVVTLPVTVAVADDRKQAVANDAMIVSVEMVADNPIGYFSAVRTIAFDVAQGSRPGEYDVVVTFDKKTPGAG
ncbi:MAG: hypothetical protein NW205_13325 [Hyphomicrobiaceae bacterium]|nr:hypothetical protein [Hyphomicrobiaceae bacterium]